MRTAFPFVFTNRLVLYFLNRIVIRYETKQMIKVLPQKAINCSADLLTKVIDDMIETIVKNLKIDLKFKTILSIIE